MVQAHVGTPKPALHSRGCRGGLGCPWEPVLSVQVDRSLSTASSSSRELSAVIGGPTGSCGGLTWSLEPWRGTGRSRPS